MKIKYDKEADAMYITFLEGKKNYTKEIDESTIIDFDDERRVIGIELLFIKERNPEILKQIQRGDLFFLQVV